MNETSSQYGKVYLVGGGPGDPGLLTLKGKECLEKADFILYDGLVNPLLLRHTKARAERTARADLAGRRTLEQEQINQRLIDEARLGKTVVRLKGGDPYIFGRGSEEAEALAAAGIDFEVVPGITAATAAAEYAGFSLTHRDHASAVCLITGHEDPDKSESALDYQLLAQFPGTLVFYMGLHRLQHIVDALLAAGLAEETPAAVITRASTPHQRVVSDRIDQLPQKVLQGKLVAPSLIVIGPAVELRSRINWFEKKPLLGLRIGITRPAGQMDPQIQSLVARGAQPVLMPLIEIHPPADWTAVDNAIDQLERYEWLIFTSSNGVESFLGRIWERGRDSRLLARTKIACIGESTAATLEKYSLRADLTPDSYCSESLAESLLARKPQGLVLWPRANRGRDVLVEALKANGITVDEVVVYQHQDVNQFSPEVQHLLERGELDWIGLSSPAIARQFAQLFPPEYRAQLGTNLKLVAISPITAQELKKLGLPVATVAKQYTWEGMFDAIEEFVGAYSD
ncbi:MAG: uroporphyrinogen-III C-methyltransferase [Planctomycetaceae bacterium]|nr:uroporphyrinogen-III C-methyltransferase [Planctomycetaceae bacterium]